MGLTLLHPQCGIIVLATTKCSSIQWARPRNGNQRAFIDPRVGCPLALYDIAMYGWLERTLDIDTGVCNGHMVARWIEQQIRLHNEQILLNL